MPTDQPRSTTSKLIIFFSIAAYLSVLAIIGIAVKRRQRRRRAQRERRIATLEGQVIQLGVGGRDQTTHGPNFEESVTHAPPVPAHRRSESFVFGGDSNADYIAEQRVKDLEAHVLRITEGAKSRSAGQPSHSFAAETPETLLVSSLPRTDQRGMDNSGNSGVTTSSSDSAKTP